jgi:hypothetical protein
LYVCLFVLLCITTGFKPSAKRTPAKSSAGIPAKSAGGMWRANLILQKSREAMMAKKTSSRNDDSETTSTQIRSVGHSVINEQFTTTGWQGNNQVSD